MGRLRVTRGEIVSIGLAGLMAMLLVLPLAAACVRPAQKPLTVRFGRLTDLTGPYAAISPPVDAGLRDYVEHYNKKFSGIEGVPVELLLTDVKDDASLFANAYRRFREQGALVVSTLSSGQVLSIKKMAEDDRTPLVTQAMNLSLFMPPSDYVWGESVASPGETVATLQWFDTRVWDRSKAGRVWKVGFLALDMPYSKGGLPGMYRYADENGIEIVGTEITPPTQLDFTVNIRRLADAGANVIFISQWGAGAGIALKQMQELGVLGTVEQAIATPRKVVPLVNDAGFYIGSMRAAPDAARLAYGVTPWAAWFEEDRFPGMKERNDFMRQKYGDVWHSLQRDGEAYNSGWNSARIIIAAIERAVKASGWEKLDGRAVVEKGLKGLKLPADMSGDLSYADYEGDRIAIERVRGARWNAERGAREPTGDFFTVDRSYYVARYTPRKPHPGMVTE